MGARIAVTFAGARSLVCDWGLARPNAGIEARRRQKVYLLAVDLALLFHNHFTARCFKFRPTFWLVHKLHTVRGCILDSLRNRSGGFWPLQKGGAGSELVATFPVMALERSHWRAGRYACKSHFRVTAWTILFVFVPSW